MDPSKYRQRDAFNTPHLTTNSGAPVTNNTSSLTAGPRGPILLEDYHLLEKLANFDRERIPERVVHARGAVAKGYFEVTSPEISALSCADLFRGVGTKTPVSVRFSTVVHSRHSPETLRDPRGFAVKFYTREGNWDLVGNNFPVFFIRDGIKFPDMVHAFKPNPRTEDQEWWRVWDFFQHVPEATHMFSFLLDDEGIPKDYRHMKGSGVHTYRLIDRAGNDKFVKFHWVPKLGEKTLLDHEAELVGGKDFSHATHDLIQAIDRGDFPEWTLAIQVMDPASADHYTFDPLDVTKTWPEDKFPFMPIGRMVLDTNVDNQFLENEQIAFSPALVVPGIYYSEDKLLQTRLFSYSDTQRYRLGANYLQLPINAPVNPHHNNHYDGSLNTMSRSSEVNYFPSKISRTGKEASGFMATPVAPLDAAPRMKQVIPKEDNFSQAGERFRSFDPARQDRFVNRVADALNAPRVTMESKATWLNNWAQADAGLGSRLAQLVNTNKM